MIAIKTVFDGERIVLPATLEGQPPQEVVVVISEVSEQSHEAEWLKAQEVSFAKIWDNDEDVIYDNL